MGDEARLHQRPPSIGGHSAQCLNCGSHLSGVFCAECGQRDIPPYPDVRELVVDAFAEFSGWDGRLATTLRALVQRPGWLTHEFLEGRRVRYISPVRLYLLASVVYFLVAAAAPNVRVRGAGTSIGGISVGVSTKQPGTGAANRPDRVANAASDAFDEQKPLTPEEREAALKDIAGAPAVVRPFLRRAVGDPIGLKRRMAEAMPRMLFVLLPVFAGIVALFYRGRKYPEHLYFAIHLHTFIFLALGATELLKFTRIPLVVALAAITALIWIPVYATMAFRRVYGGSLKSTVMKEIGIGMLYAVASGVGFMAMVYWVSVGS